MPHQRERYLLKLLEKSLKYSPIVGVFGHRQVGKTTLVTSISKNYVTLDDRLKLATAEQDPESFLKNSLEKRKTEVPGFTIDECQFSPPLFPAMKEWVRKNPKPGQLLLTGSVRFSSRKAIRESLTGRLVAWELLPMNLSESHSAPLRSTIPDLIRAPSVEVDLKESHYTTPSNLDSALLLGGLPGVFSVRNPGIRRQKFETSLNTILERDLQLIHQTSVGYTNLRLLLESLALNQTRPIEWVRLSRASKISVPSLKKIIHALESMFVIRQIPTEGSEKKSVLYFEDQGEATFLAGNRYDEKTQFERLLFSELRVQAHYRPELEIQMFQFRNRGGAYIPLCFRRHNRVLGIVPILTEKPETGAFATARSFFKSYPESKLIFVHKKSTDEIIDKRTRVLGIRRLI